MKQVPSPQLVRIADPVLVQIDSLASEAIAFGASEAIDTPQNSQETLWEEFLGANGEFGKIVR